MQKAEQGTRDRGLTLLFAGPPSCLRLALWLGTKCLLSPIREMDALKWTHFSVN